MYIYYQLKVWDHLDCFAKLSIKANFAIDHKVLSELPKIKQNIFIH